MKETIVVARTVDLGTFSDPLSIVKTRQTLDSIRHGEVVRIIATDSGLLAELVAFTHRTGHILLEYYERGNQQIFHVQKKLQSRLIDSE